MEKIARGALVRVATPAARANTLTVNAESLHHTNIPALDANSILQGSLPFTNETAQNTNSSAPYYHPTLSGDIIYKTDRHAVFYPSFLFQWWSAAAISKTTSYIAVIKATVYDKDGNIKEVLVEDTQREATPTTYATGAVASGATNDVIDLIVGFSISLEPGESVLYEYNGSNKTANVEGTFIGIDFAYKYVPDSAVSAESQYYIQYGRAI